MVREAQRPVVQFSLWERKGEICFLSIHLFKYYIKIKGFCVLVYTHKKEKKGIITW